MANENIKDYVDEAVTLGDTDLLDVSVDKGAGVFRSEKMTGSTLKSQAAASVATIFTSNASLTSTRQVDFNSKTLSFTGVGGFFAIGAISTGVYKLEIASNASEHALRVNTNSSNNVLTVTDDGSSGKVGIGLSNATEGLHSALSVRFDNRITRGISSADAAFSVHFATTGATDGIVQQVSSNATSIYPFFTTFRTRGTVAAPAAVLVNDVLADYAASAYSGVLPVQTATMRMVATETHSVGSSGSAIQFLTTANGTSLHGVKVTFDHNGNVGIGTILPTEKLMVMGNVRATDAIIGSPAAGNAYFSHISNLTVTGYGVRHESNGNLHLNTKSGQVIRFNVDNGAAKMTMTAAGDFGIGTVSPTEKLHVVGNVFLTNTKIGAPSGSAAYFAQSGFFTLTNYGFLHTNTGIARMNAPTGVEIQFSNNNVPHTRVVANKWGYGVVNPSEVIDAAGSINASVSYKIGTTKVIGAQGSAVADATDNPSAITQINLLLARARTHGLIAT